MIASEDTVLFTRLPAAVACVLSSILLSRGIARLYMAFVSGDSDLTRLTALFSLVTLPLGLFCGILFLRRPDPEFCLRADIPTEKRYTFSRLHTALWDKDTLFGRPGAARIRGYGRVVLYGPGEGFVFVFAVPSPLRKKVSVRLMSAVSQISKYGSPTPSPGAKIRELLGRLREDQVREGSETPDFGAVLGPMAAEISRLLSDEDSAE